MKNTIGKAILKIISISFMIFFIIVVFNIIFCNRTIAINYNIPIMVVGTLLLYALIFFIYYKYKNGKFSFLDKIPSKIKIFCIILIIFLMQCIVLALTCYSIGWDSGIVIGNTVRLLNGESGFEYWYFARYPNNIGMLLLVKYILIFSKIFTHIITEYNAFFIMALVNIIAIDLTVLITECIIKKILGEKYVYLSFIFILPLILFSPYIIIPYTDTLTMIFPVLLLYLYIIIKELSEENIKKYLLILLSGIIFAFGIFLKPTVAIILIAIAIVEILNFENSNRDKKKILKDLCYMIITIVIFGIGFLMQYSAYFIFKEKTLGDVITSDVYEKYSLSYTHFLMMGMQQQPQNANKNEKRLYGTYNLKDVINTFAVNGYKEKQKYNMKIVKERLNNFGMAGYIDFLYNKANWILSDGTFFYGQEGNWKTSDYYNQSKVAQIVQKFINTKTNTYKITANFMQIIWILLIIGLIFSYKKPKNSCIYICKFSIIGIIAFILLFEGRSRYLISYLPIFILVATYGIGISLKNVLSIIKNRKVFKKESNKNGEEKNIISNSNVL